MLVIDINFLQIPATSGVEEEVAEKDACSMEHVMDVSTLGKFKKFVEFIDVYPDAQDFLEKYREYSK